MVLIDDTDIGSADYRIHVYQPRFLKEARGYINAGHSVIQQSRAPNMAVLELESGGTVNFLVTQWDIASGRANINITGPIPGF